MERGFERGEVPRCDGLFTLTRPLLDVFGYISLVQRESLRNRAEAGGKRDKDSEGDADELWNLWTNVDYSTHARRNMAQGRGTTYLESVLVVGRRDIDRDSFFVGSVGCCKASSRGSEAGDTDNYMNDDFGGSQRGTDSSLVVHSTVRRLNGDSGSA